MSAATHEKQISTVGPWLWLGSGGVTIALTAVWAGFAAIYERLSTGHGIAMIGLMLFGGILVFIGMPERRRAEDWDNWKEPATKIAEIHAAVCGGDARLSDVEMQVVALREVAADVLLEIRKNQILLLSRLGGEGTTANGHVDDDPSVVHIDDMRLLKRIDERLRENRDN